MKKMFWIILLSILTFSCVTEKQRQKILNTCPQNTNSDQKEKIREIRHDSIIYVPMKKDTVSSSSVLPCDKPINIGRTYLKSKYITAWFQIDNNVITQGAYLNNDSIGFIVHDARVVHDTLTAKSKIITLPTKIITEYKTPWYNYIAYTILVLIILVLLFFLVKQKFKNILRL